MDDFRKGKFRYLVATDVVDIDNITHVINYDIPLEKKATYIVLEERDELEIVEKLLHL